jgi:hypothetical protein
MKCSLSVAAPKSRCGNTEECFREGRVPDLAAN